MDPERVHRGLMIMAEGLEMVAEGLEMVAEVYGGRAGVADSPPTAPALAPLRPAAPPSPPAVAAPLAAMVDVVCPSHGAEWRSGQSGRYCPAKSAEPAWANRKGYCTITPENAGQWLAIHAG